ncbi:MAG: hypothetical protein IKN12_11020 [Selenomonadaceae bacterium]|nr:hypothetical protein [Selenomonadaceae bacterium]
MSYKVLIPTAGTGSRLGGMTKYINKSLISVGNRPALSWIIDAFPRDCEFVIATGYKGELVKEFCSLAYPDRKIQFVDILLYEGEGSGLGLTVLSCKDYLQEPFVFCACDTIVTENIPNPNVNWVGYDHREALNRYRKVHINKDRYVTSIDEKDAAYGELSEPYIGLAGIRDYKLFWETMENGGDIAILQGESYGLKALIEKGLCGEKFTWFDIGVKVELEATRKRFNKPGDPNILEKANEAIWFLNDRVIKFCDKSNFISDRVKRAKLLKDFTPHMVGNTTHMYCYNYVKGDVISKCVSLPLFKELLSFSKKFWVEKQLDENDKDFCELCLKFYRDKTYERIELFYKNFGKSDSSTYINRIKYPKLKDLLEEVDWEYISQGLPGRFHGDFHFENIIYDESTNTFKLLDWRQNFQKLLDIGDIYYDLAKLNHGLIVCHELIAKDLYEISWKNDDIKFDFARKQILVECESAYYKWLDSYGYDVWKVKVLTALIFLNIAGLHHYPYGLMLYALGKKMLADCLAIKKERGENNGT